MDMIHQQPQHNLNTYLFTQKIKTYRPGSISSLRLPISNQLYIHHNTRGIRTVTAPSTATASLMRIQEFFGVPFETEFAFRVSLVPTMQVDELDAGPLPVFWNCG